jgi:hypothetical protein
VDSSATVVLTRATAASVAVLSTLVASATIIATKILHDGHAATCRASRSMPADEMRPMRRDARSWGASGSCRDSRLQALMLRIAFAEIERRTLRHGSS